MLAAVEAHLGSRQVTRVLYGSIIGLALVLTFELHPPEDTTIAGSLVATAIAVGLAELYSDVIGTETRERRHVTRHDMAHMLEDVAAVVVGVSFPAVFFVLAGLGLLETGTAFDLARWSGLGLIGGYGFFAAHLAGSSLLRSLAHAVVVVLLGALLILAKAVIH